MNNNKKLIAIITARGGSKRIPRKNIKPFLGQPIIKYSIDAALNSKLFDEVMVSTDDIEIAELAKKFGASVPFIRSNTSSDDYATTVDVLVEVLNDYLKKGVSFDYCCCLYPTAPFVTAKKLVAAFELLKNSDADSVLPITKFSFPILRSVKIENGFVKLNWPEHMNSRSQDLPQAFHDCGQFYFAKNETIIKQKCLFTDFTVPLEIPESEVQDIDNEEDWKIAEMKYSILKKSNK